MDTRSLWVRQGWWRHAVCGWGRGGGGKEQLDKVVALEPTIRARQAQRGLLHRAAEGGPGEKQLGELMALKPTSRAESTKWVAG